MSQRTDIRLLQNQSLGQVFCLQNSIYFNGAISVKDLVMN